MRSRELDVVVSGIGLATALGTDRETTWSALRRGCSGLRPLDSGDVGAPLLFSAPDDEDPVLHLVDALVDEACADASLDFRSIDRDRVATLIGLSKGGVHALSRLGRGSGRLPEAETAHWWRRVPPSAAASRTADRHDLRGPISAPIAACATGLVAVLQGAALIRSGACDIALAGSADASLEPWILGAFRSMKALAPLDRDPARAVRPWDRDRSGFLVGEGGGIVILESASSVAARGVRPIAVLSGGGIGSDAHHITGLNPDPGRLARLIGGVLDRAGISPAEIDHVNVHGTATRPNDPLECGALRSALGAWAERVSCSANKAQIGHLLGAAGSAELAITCLAIRDGFVPPTLNLDNPDSACDLDGTPHVGRARTIRHALKLSIGFGGHLAVALLTHPEAT